MKFSTKVVHNVGVDPLHGALSTPIYLTSSNTQKASADLAEYCHMRSGNPNFTALEKTLASLEKAEHASCFSSGMGALTAIAALLKKGDRVLALGGLSGGTWHLLAKVFSRFGVEFNHVMNSDLEKAEQLIRTIQPQWLLFETPSNPLLEIIDIEAFAELAKRYGALTIVDNTFATPMFQNPLDWGADIVWHSTTKYINGHSDALGGVVMTNSSSIKRELDDLRSSLGINPSPFDSWLIARGVKTLALRVEKQHSNARDVAIWLERHPKIGKVYYPGLSDHPHHAIAKKQMSGFGGIVSAEFNISPPQLLKFIATLSLFTETESLGSVESLICLPALTTHAAIPPEGRQKMGISEGLVRFSCGIEEIKDLLDDLQQSLELVS